MESKSSTAAQTINDNKKIIPVYLYRTEEAYGSQVRNLEAVIEYEVFELGNTDIFDYILNHYDLDQKGVRIAFMHTIKTMQEICETGDADDSAALNRVIEKNGDKMKKSFIESVIEMLHYLTNKKLVYALWLTDKENVIKFYGGIDDKDASNIDMYRTSDVILSDLGPEGMLFGYENYPEPISIFDEFVAMEQALSDNLAELKKNINNNNADIEKYEGLIKDKAYTIFSQYNSIITTMQHIRTVVKEIPKCCEQLDKFSYIPAHGIDKIYFSGEKIYLPEINDSYECLCIGVDNNKPNRRIGALHILFNKPSPAILVQGYRCKDFTICKIENIDNHDAIVYDYHTDESGNTEWDAKEKIEILKQIDDLLLDFMTYMPKFVRKFIDITRNMP